MKKGFYFGLAAMAALLAAACEKAPEEGKDLNANILTEFRAEIADLSVKSLVDPSTGKTSWQKGDEVLVDNGKTRAKFVYNSTRDVFVTTATDFALADSYTAWFPSDAAEGFPSQVSVRPGYVKNAPLKATAGKDAVFRFQHSCAVATVEFPADMIVSGKEKDIASIAFTGGSTNIRYDCSEAGVSALQPLYLLVPAAAYPSVRMEFTFTDGVKYELGCDSAVNIPAGSLTLLDLVKPWAHFSGGAGTQEDPWKIATVADVKELAELLASGEAAAFGAASYLQTQDIDLSAIHGFSPLGKAPFTGVYDGGSHTLRGMKFNNQASAPSGLFRESDGATIKNLTVEADDCRSSYMYLGGFVGLAKNTTFLGCTFKGELVSTAKYAWDGWNAARVTTDANNTGFCGGFVAYADGCTFDGCSFEGKISSFGKNIGGIAGFATGGTVIRDCKAVNGSEVYSYYHVVGGIAGALIGDSVIEKCSSEAYLGCLGYWTGGIVGYVQSGTVRECVTGCHASVNERQYNAGGIAGGVQPLAGGTALIDRCTAYCDVQGQYNVAGIAGVIVPAGSVRISNCTFQGGTLYSTGTNGGSNCYNLVGGVCGWVQNQSGGCVIENCAIRPALVKTSLQNAQTGSDNAYSNGAVGGLVGFVHPNVTMGNCYSTFTCDKILYRYQSITPSTFKNYGGVFGTQRNGVTFSSPCFYDSGIVCTTDAGGYDAQNTALTPAQMTDGTLLASLNAGSPEVTWTAGADGYPCLSCQIADPTPRTTIPKRVSVIGDSISTFAGYIPAGYNYHYPCADGSVTAVNQTYWYRLIYDYMKDARLDMNMSYSGSAVTRSTNPAKSSNHWYENCYVQRYLRQGGVGDPDIVLIHGGTNDWAHNDCPLFPGSGLCHDAPAPTATQIAQVFSAADAATTRADIEALNDTDFCSAYVKLVRLIQQQYPGVKIVCIIGDYLSVGIEQSLLMISEHYGLKSVDLLAVNGFNDQKYMPKHDFNGTSGCHPNAVAMKFIAEKIYSDLGPWLEE